MARVAGLGGAGVHTVGPQVEGARDGRGRVRLGGVDGQNVLRVQRRAEQPRTSESTESDSIRHV